MKPHRGTLVLGLGVFGLGFFVLVMPVWAFLGIPAWIMGSNDLAQMAAGKMDPSGRALTNAGRICGIIAVVLLILAVVIRVLSVVSRRLAL